MIRRPPRSTLDRSSAASDVYKRQIFDSIVSEYSDSYFKSYLLKTKDFLILTLKAETDDAELNKDLNKSFSNIRTLKFALELSLINISEPTRPY